MRIIVVIFWLEGGYFAFMETIAIKIAIDINTLSKVLPISITSPPKSKDFTKEANRSSISYDLRLLLQHIRRELTIILMYLLSI